MLRLLTHKLVAAANVIARQYHPGYYCTAHQMLGEVPAHGELPADLVSVRALRVWYGAPTDRFVLLYCESPGTDGQLLAVLRRHLEQWLATGHAPDDYLPVTEHGATDLLRLAQHPLTAAADRQELLETLLARLPRAQARAWAADLTEKIDARAPGVLTGRGWMLHGESVPTPSPHPFALEGF